MLNLNDLGNGLLPAISPTRGMALAEAGGVCLESRGHVMGAQLHVSGCANNIYLLEWPPVTDQMRRTWNDLQEATEDGAMGIAVLLAKKETGYAVLERSRKGTGFDYWMGDESIEPFQAKARLEISGILHGGDHEVRKRVRQKLRQTARSDGLLPAYVIVVEFGKPQAQIQNK